MEEELEEEEEELEDELLFLEFPEELLGWDNMKKREILNYSEYEFSIHYSDKSHL